MNEYNIIYQVDENYKVLITICNSDSPFEYLSEIEKKLLDDKVQGKILIDQILHVGNTQERFLDADIDENGLKKETIEIVNIPKASLYRKLSCDFLKKMNGLEYSILSSIQKKMISKGIAI